MRQLFSLLLPSQRRYNDVCESWGGHPSTPGKLDDPADGDAIPAGKSRQLVAHFVSSFLSQGKMIPLNMVPVTMEFELADSDEVFNESNTSWEIARPRLIADVCQMDQALQNSTRNICLTTRFASLRAQSLQREGSRS